MIATTTRTYAIDKTHSDAAFSVRHLISMFILLFSDF